MQTVLTSATSEALVNVQDVKEALGLTDNVDETLLTRFIDRASARIASYCGRAFTVQRYEAILPGHGCQVLQLPSYPVRTIFSVHETTDTGVTALSATEYRLDTQTGQLQRTEGWPWTGVRRVDLTMDPEVDSEVPTFRVEYSAGFSLGKDSGSTWDGTTSTGRTLPLDLEEAAIGLVRRAWLARERDPSVVSEKVGDLSLTYQQPSSSVSGMAQRSGFPADIADLLDPYRSLT
jgi:hypothetical protein